MNGVDQCINSLSDRLDEMEKYYKRVRYRAFPF